MEDKENINEKRKKFINELKTISPEMKVHFIDQTKADIWDSEKTLKDLNEKELEQVNLRKQLPNEVILDIENKFRKDDIIEQLDKRKWSYSAWNTGSRGIHIVLKFQNLSQCPLELRNRIRRYVIEEFQTDDKLAKETQWFALEYSKHFKTGNVKTLITEADNGLNHIHDDVIDYCKKELAVTEDLTVEPDEDYSDYLENDPYLLYALKNRLDEPGQSKNDMLFKNLAIGLVKSGLPRDECKKVAIKITNNCSGHNVAEFMGWVDKALRGELTDYNKGELVQWSILYGHPVMYQLVDDEQTLEILSIKQLWDILWNSQIAQQPVWRDLCFYNLISTIIKEERDDLRIHVLFSCISSSGKDEGLNLVRQILDKMEYKTYKPAEITDRTMIGSVNTWAQEYNSKKGLKEGDEGWREVRDYGLLANENSDWLAFGEAETVLKPGSHNKKIQLILRQAMDKERKIEKGVGGVMFSIYTNTPISLTTYSMDKDLYKLLHNGLFQRMLFYRKELTKEDHKAIRKHIALKNFSPTIRKNFNKTEYMGMLIEKLRKMKLWYDENKHKIESYNEVVATIDNRWESYEKEYEPLPKTDSIMIDSMVRRAGTHLYKLLMLTGVWKMQTKLNVEDIDRCFDLLFTCIDSVKDLIMSQDKSTKQIMITLQILKTGSMTSGNLQKEMKKSLNLKSTASRTNLLKKLKRFDLVSSYADGKYKRYTLTDKGREYIAED